MNKWLLLPKGQKHENLTSLINWAYNTSALQNVRMDYRFLPPLTRPFLAAPAEVPVP